MAPASDAALAAALFAIDPQGLGGVCLRSAAGPARDQWVARLQALFPEGVPWRRVPLHIADDRLMGGPDLVATLQCGRPVSRPGLLAEAAGGVVLVAMAERVGTPVAARIAAAMDGGPGATPGTAPARPSVVALDEGDGDDEQVPQVLAERLGLLLRLEPRAALEAPGIDRAAIADARRRLPEVRMDDDLAAALCEAAWALGLRSMRAPWQALCAARAASALRGGRSVNADDAALAARLVLGPRASQCPQFPQADEAPAAEPPASPPDAAERAAPPAPPPSSSAAPGAMPQDAEARPGPPDPASSMTDRVREAVTASLPAGLLGMAQGTRRSRAARQAAGHAGEAGLSATRGRPLPSVRGALRGGAPLDLMQTLQAAAPWQALRRRERPASAAAGPALAVQVRPEDFRLRRHLQRRESVTIFAVDASGSQALHRLGEAKGAVELLLADCYVRRDRVAVVAFRGHGAELLLPPTRSLVRAKRSLAELPGGGGTPLAAGIEAALDLATGAARQGLTPTLVLLTDGRANVGRGGAAGRAQAQADALCAARAWQRAGRAALLLDTAPQPQAQAHGLATAMGARYLALPCAGSADLAKAVAAHRTVAA